MTKALPTIDFKFYEDYKGIRVFRAVTGAHTAIYSMMLGLNVLAHHDLGGVHQLIDDYFYMRRN